MNWLLLDSGDSSSMTGNTHRYSHLCGWFSQLNTEHLVSSRWSKFHGDLNSYKKKLEGALVIHALIRELEEVRDRANEKVSHLMPP